MAELTEAREETTRQATALSSIINTVVDGIITIDAQGIVETLNPAAENLFGYNADEVIGQNIKMLMPDPYRGEHDGYLGHYRATAEARIIGIGREVEGLRKDGSTFPMELAVSEMQVDGRQMFTGIVRDISERQKFLAELTDTREEANQANRAKSAFLANMSHEIRTPMNGIIGMAELLGQHDLNEEQQHMLQTIQNSSSSLLRIIDDILDFSKIEAGKLTVETIPFSVCQVMEGVAELLMPTADKRQVALHLYIDPQIPARVPGDPLRLRQILANLLSNAIKFTGVDPAKAGWVQLRADPCGDDSVCFQVIDNGIGLDAAAQAGLFKAFVQAEGSTTRQFGGTGLGLAICKQLAGLMGGDISVDSEPGNGSTFAVTLPLVAAQTDTTVDKQLDISGLRVLAVLSDGFGREAIGRYLQAGDATVDFVDEPAAVAPALAHAPAYDILLVGSEHPELAQHDMTEAVYTAGLTPPRRLLLSHNRAEKIGIRGADTYIVSSTPTLYSSFMRGVATLAGRLSPEPVFQSMGEWSPTAEPPDSAQAEAQGRLILLAEDNETNREVITQQLQKLGYAAETADDGREGFEKWQSGRYGLVLTDCHMPEMDGFELTEAIRQQEQDNGAGRVPIIAITANALLGEAGRCLAAGMDDYLAKPVRLQGLWRTLSRWLPPEGVVVGSGAVEAAAPVDSAPAERSAGVLDFAALSRVIGDDPDLQRKLLQAFVKPTQKIVGVMVEAMEARDAVSMHEQAHKLKSSARTIGADALADTCQLLETAGRAEDWASIDSRFPDLAPQTQEVFDCIEDAT
jgi:PAS domain S-box-containing protein